MTQDAKVDLTLIGIDLARVRISTEQHMWVSLLDGDITSVGLSWNGYMYARQQIYDVFRSPNDDKIGAIGALQADMFYYAKNYVCAMRRAGRLFESIRGRRGIFPAPVADVIKLEWNKRKKLFESYVEPRNAIEHIDDEYRRNTSFALVNLTDDTLYVTATKPAEISQDNLALVIRSRNEVVNAIHTHMAFDDSLPA